MIWLIKFDYDVNFTYNILKWFSKNIFRYIKTLNSFLNGKFKTKIQLLFVKEKQ